MKTRDSIGNRIGLVVFLATPLAIVVALLFAIADSVSDEAKTLGPGGPPTTSWPSGDTSDGDSEYD